MCLSEVCLSTAILALQATRLAVSSTNCLRTTWAQRRNCHIPERKCLRLTYAVIKAKKPLYIIALGYLHLIHLVCIALRHSKSQRRACIDSRMRLASLRPTLCGLLAIWWPSPCTTHAQCAECLHVYFLSFFALLFTKRCTECRPSSWVYKVL